MSNNMHLLKQSDNGLDMSDLDILKAFLLADRENLDRLCYDILKAKFGTPQAICDTVEKWAGSDIWLPGSPVHYTQALPASGQEVQFYDEKNKVWRQGWFQHHKGRHFGDNVFICLDKAGRYNSYLASDSKHCQDYCAKWWKAPSGPPPTNYNASGLAPDKFDEVSRKIENKNIVLKSSIIYVIFHPYNGNGYNWRASVSFRESNHDADSVNDVGGEMFTDTYNTLPYTLDKVKRAMEQIGYFDAHAGPPRLIYEGDSEPSPPPPEHTKMLISEAKRIGFEYNPIDRKTFCDECNTKGGHHPDDCFLGM